MPVTFQPRRRADSVTARMTAFRPGASPPPVLTRTCILQRHIVAARQAQERRLETFALYGENCEPSAGVSRPTLSPVWLAWAARSAADAARRQARPRPPR